MVKTLENIRTVTMLQLFENVIIHEQSVIEYKI